MDISSMLSNENGNDDTPNKRTELLGAIDSANLDRVRKVLKEICTENTAAFDLACTKLLAEDSGNQSKRKREPAPKRFEICGQCRKEYDTTNNPNDACRWHDGETEPDYASDFWADRDEDIHGTIDTEFCRYEYPEGFVWTCCDKLTEEEGCKVDVHRPQPAKKAKVDPLAEFDAGPQELLDRPYVQQHVAELEAEARATSRPPRESYKQCIQCEKSYDTLAEPSSCSWHSGELEAIYESDVWADHDERCHGPIDTEENQRDFPKGFMWDCCERRGDESGCEIDVHRCEI